MNSKQPFEDAFERQMKDLPAPNEDQSWQKMNALLNDKDDRVPFVFFRNYIVWSIALLVVIVGAWVVIHAKKATHKSAAAASENHHVLPGQTASHSTSKPTVKQPVIIPPAATQTSTKPISKEPAPPDNLNTPTASIPDVSPGKTQGKVKHISIAANKLMPVKYKRHLSKYQLTKSADIANNIFLNAPNSGITPNQNLPNKPLTLPEISANSQSADTVSIAKNDPSTQSSVVAKDTAVAQAKPAKNPAIAAAIKLNGHKKYFASASIGIQQQVPVSGQKTVGYGYNGHSAISDYIPSLYFRIERDKQWFLQAGFSYAAPQLVREFSYSRQSKADNASGTITTTSLRLRKTFYSEVPVSFNYYISRNWTMGAGAMYNWFHSAITEQQVSTSNVQTHALSTVNRIVPLAAYNDSFLYRSHTYLLLQTDYNWRRFAFGLRYARDVQPYIRYTLPDGVVKDQKNWSLELFVRFRLWKSGYF